jgi:AAA+ superfamily predicted ATPase
MDNAADLSVLLASQYPLLVVATDEEPRFLEQLRRAARERDIPVWTWTATQGLARDGQQPQYQSTDPGRALSFVAEVTTPGAFVFADANPMLKDPVVVRRIKELAQAQRRSQTIVLTAPAPQLPEDLEGLAHRWRLRPPDRDELLRLVRSTVRQLADRGFPVMLGDDRLEEMAEALRGITLREAAGLIRQRALQDGNLDSIPALRAAKAELLNTDGVLEIVESDAGTLDEIGGLDGLKSWLRLRRIAMDSHTPGLDPPRGILLTGVPGCGKSLVAKSLSRSWGLPLVLLDPSRLYGKYVGESETRLDTSLRTIEAMAPSILWIDEIEKGFAAGDQDGGVARRLLGTFLRWLQDHTGDIFLIATANQIDALPPELLRKGRFDEIFFVDLPDAAARREILRVHLAKRGVDPEHVDIERLVERTAGFSGAEIETAIVGARYRAVADRTPVSTNQLEAELSSTVPLSVSRAEDVVELRAWARDRAKMA